MRLKKTINFSFSRKAGLSVCVLTAAVLVYENDRAGGWWNDGCNTHILNVPRSSPELNTGNIHRGISSRENEISGFECHAEDIAVIQGISTVARIRT